MVKPNQSRRRAGRPESSRQSPIENQAASRKVRERRSLRWHLVFYMEVALGLAVTWALLALVYYLTDPQVLMFESWFR